MIAELLAKNLWADLLEIKPTVEIENKWFMKYVWWGKQAMMKETPDLLPYDKDPWEYDFLVIGTPVWAFTFSPPIRSFIVERTFSDKKIALFCCHWWGKGSTLEKMAESLDGNEIISNCDFRDPKTRNSPEQMKKAVVWAQELREIFSNPEEEMQEYEQEQNNLPIVEIVKETQKANDERDFEPPIIPPLKKK